MTNTGSSKMSIEDMIGHYQRSIEKSENDPKRVSVQAPILKFCSFLLFLCDWRQGKQALFSIFVIQ